MTYLFAWEFSATYLFLKKSYLLDNKFLNWCRKVKNIVGASSNVYNKKILLWT